MHLCELSSQPFGYANLGSHKALTLKVPCQKSPLGDLNGGSRNLVGYSAPLSKAACLQVILHLHTVSPLLLRGRQKLESCQLRVWA